MTPELLNSIRSFQTTLPLDPKETQNSIGQAPGVNLLFVDSSVDNIDNLISQVEQGTQVVFLNNQSDGISQITDALANYQNVASLSVLSHGDSGQLQLGASTISSASLNNYRDELQSWQTSLSADADILFYGCNVAAGQQGERFLSQFGHLTGADIAGSDDLTGSAELGGDWHLEYTTGDIEAEVPFDEEAMGSYQSVLNTFSEDFSSGRISKSKFGIQDRQGGMRITNDPGGGSGRVLEVNLRRDGAQQGGRLRSELVAKTGAVRNGGTYTYEIKTYIPQNWKADRDIDEIMQWKGIPDQNDKGNSAPAMSMRVSGNSYQLVVRHDRNRTSTGRTVKTVSPWRGNLKKGEWVSWKFEVKWGHSGGGFARVFQNGRQVANYKGAIGYNDAKMPIWKFGVYKPGWTARPKGSNTTSRKLYFDDVRFREGANVQSQSLPAQEQNSPSQGGSNSGSNQDLADSPQNSTGGGNSGEGQDLAGNQKNSKVIRIEAEALQLHNYRVEKNSSASGGKLISLRGRQSNEAGRAVYVHRGSKGTYDLDLKYFDENDGTGQFQVNLNGKRVGRWTLNARSGSSVANARSRRSRTIEGLSLKAGDRLTIVGNEHRGEYARLDSLVLKPAGGSNNNQNRSATNGFTRTYQAENAKLVSVSPRQGNNKVQGGRYVKFDRSSNDAIEWTINVPEAGNYRLDWRYAQGDSSRSPLNVVVNGRTDSASPLFSSTGGWNNWELAGDTVFLKQGRNTIRLRASGKTRVNIDSLKVVSA